MELVTPEITKKLRKKGFTFESPITGDNEGNYHHFVDPYISQVFEWLRKEKNLYVCIDISRIYYHNERKYEYKYIFYITNLVNHDRESSFEKFDSPKPAAIAAIEYALNYLIEED